MGMAQDVREAHAAAASTATLVHHMMDRLDANHQENLSRASDLAAAATASRNTDLEKWSILATRLTATREADNSTLDARITPLVTGLMPKPLRPLRWTERLRGLSSSSPWSRCVHNPTPESMLPTQH